MRVLLVNSVYGRGSTGRICADLAAALTQSGHECLAAYGRSPAEPAAEEILVRIGTNRDVALHGLYTRLTDRHGFSSAVATERWLEKVQAFAPDVIHLQNLHGYYMYLPALFSFLRDYGAPVIWTLHDCWAFTGHCAHFLPFQCEKWKTGCESCPARASYPASLRDASRRNYLQKKALICALNNLTVVTPSNWLAEVAGESFLRSFPIVTIPNGINTEVFRPRGGSARTRLHLEHGRMLLAVSGVWNREKGFEDLLLLSQKLEKDDTLVVVGVTERQKKRLPANVIGLTHTEHAEELAELYSAADVFLNLTYADTYPTVNLEAAACAVPVISYRSGGSAECASLTVEPGDLDGIVRALSALDTLSPPNIPLDRGDMIRQYLRLYETAAARGGKA